MTEHPETTGSTEQPPAEQQTAAPASERPVEEVRPVEEALPAQDSQAVEEPLPPVPEAQSPVPEAQPVADPGPTVAENAWGRVTDDGSVYLRRTAGELLIGSWQTGDPQEALEFYGRRFDDLMVQVELVDKRLGAGSASPEDAVTVVRRVREAIATPQAIGDIDGLVARLDALEAEVARRREERRAARARALEEARVAKEAIAAEAEQIAESSDWRRGADRLRALLDQWKSLPRLDRATDDVLWRRFSTARTHYTRRRKAHFAEVGERREEARTVKESLVAEAEALAGSTEWGETARKFRDLMARWKAAGGAPRGVEDQLWSRFRAAQDAFFAARQEEQSARDTEFSANLQAKEALLIDAEALLPVTDWKAARAALRSIQDRWEAAGKVPREAMRSVEARLRKVEDAVRNAEESDWRRTNPEARARAEDTVAQLRSSIDDLEARAAAATAKGDQRGVSEAQAALETRRAWLAEAEKALADFGG